MLFYCVLLLVSILSGWVYLWASMKNFLNLRGESMLTQCWLPLLYPLIHQGQAVSVNTWSRPISWLKRFWGAQAGGAIILKPLYTPGPTLPILFSWIECIGPLSIMSLHTLTGDTSVIKQGYRSSWLQTTWYMIIRALCFRPRLKFFSVSRFRSSHNATHQCYFPVSWGYLE